ncbi:MAG: DUF4097 family beta strand repeat-containing protein [Gemmatimonadales bacterium]
MRTPVVTTLAIALAAVTAGRALPAQETRFSPTIRAGQHLDISTIDGDVSVTRGEGRTAEIVATKHVRRGDASRVKAVMEQTSDGYKVCTIYLHRDEPDRDTCNGGSDRRRNNWRDNDNYDIEMSYVVRLPAGAVLGVHTVDGNVDVRGVDVAATINTVDGDVTYEGVAPTKLSTVDGDIRATISTASWIADASMSTVDGSIDVSLPADIALEIHGSTVDGSFRSDFPLTIRDKWGPRSIQGTIGNGATRSLRLGSVDGDITLRRR